jgi:hypothetical protein
LRLVNSISDPRIKTSTQQLPGLYHPRQGAQAAWLEIAIGVLLPAAQPFYKSFFQSSLKGNLAAIIFSLVGQHYYLTLRHSVKRNQIEAAVRSYTERQLKAWSEQQQSLRARLFKPLQPTLEKWSRSLKSVLPPTKAFRLNLACTIRNREVSNIKNHIPFCIQNPFDYQSAIITLRYQTRESFRFLVRRRYFVRWRRFPCVQFAVDGKSTPF